MSGRRVCIIDAIANKIKCLCLPANELDFSDSPADMDNEQQQPLAPPPAQAMEVEPAPVQLPAAADPMAPGPVDAVVQGGAQPPAPGGNPVVPQNPALGGGPGGAVAPAEAVQPVPAVQAEAVHPVQPAAPPAPAAAVAPAGPPPFDHQQLMLQLMQQMQQQQAAFLQNGNKRRNLMPTMDGGAHEPPFKRVQPRNAQGRGSNPLGLTKIRGPDGRLLSHLEWGMFKAKGLCLICGQAGHRAADCPNKENKPPKK